MVDLTSFSRTRTCDALYAESETRTSKNFTSGSDPASSHDMIGRRIDIYSLQTWRKSNNL